MNLDASLAQLETAELVRRTDETELTYQFRHALTQDSAYALLLKHDRVRLHRRAAQAYESLYADRLNEFAALLAQHYAQADDDSKTLEYATRAGDAAARVYANAEAIIHYTLAIAAAERLATTQSQQLIELYSKRGRAFELAGQHEQALQSYERLAELANERADGALRLASLMLRATLHNIHTRVHDSARGEELAQQALSLARELGDTQAEARILWSLMLANQWGAGGAKRAIEYGELALALARTLDLREQLAYTLSDLAYPYLFAGQLPQARALREEAQLIWRELDIKPMMTDNLTGLANIYVIAGDFEQAVAAAKESFGISEDIGNIWGQSYSQAILGSTYVELAQFDEAAAALEAGIQMGETVGAIGPLLVSAAALADLYSFVGAFTRALEWARYGDEKAETQLREWRPWTLATLARIHLLTGDLKNAEEAIKGLPVSREEIFRKVTPRGAVAAILAQGGLALAQQDYDRAAKIVEDFAEYLRGRGMYASVPGAMYMQGEILLGQGKSEQAWEMLHQAREAALALNARRSLFAISSSLAQIEQAHPNLIDAESASTQAREVLAYILAHATRADLREPLLNLSAVRSILETPGATQ